MPPEVSASLVGSVDALDHDVIKELIARNMEGLGFRGLKLDVRLGMFTSVKLGLLPAPIPAIPAGV